MLYLTCIMISGVDLAPYGVSYAKDLGIWDCGTIYLFVLHISSYLSLSSCSRRCPAVGPK